jgi:hypothetical protein
MGAHPVSSSRVLHIIGPMQALASSSDSILGFASAMFLNSKTSLYKYFFCNSRTHVITLYLSLVCAVLFVNASVLAPHMDPDYD